MDFRLIAILAISMIIAIGARRLRLPYTVGLVFMGAALSFSPVDFGIELTHDLVFELLLPPLLFELALSLHWQELRSDLAPILLFSILGTAAAAALVATGMAFLLGWPPPAALLFGTLIAATDPVAVIAMLKENGVKGRLRVMIESESLFNDGVAAVLFGLALGWAQTGGAAPDTGQVLRGLALTAAGGIGIGLAAGLLIHGIVGRTTDHLIAAALTMVAAYGSFALAEHFGVSGVLATVSAGLLLGNLDHLWVGGEPIPSFRGRAFTHSFWEFVAFLANSILFPLIGARIAEARLSAGEAAMPVIVVLLVLASRAFTVYPLSLPFLGSTRAIPWREQNVLWWGGLRGALGLALALSIPASVPYRDEILIATFIAVAFSIVVQGLTMPLLLRATDIAPRPASR